MIKNIVFDMGNVLLAYNPQKYLSEITKDKIAAKAVLKELFHGEEWQMLDAGKITEDDIVSTVKKRIPEYSELVEKAMRLWHTDLTPIQGMPEIIKDVKKSGYNIYLLSNTSLRFFTYCDKVDMFKQFNGFFISAKAKLLKPDAQIYRAFLQNFSLKAEECLFIDDVEENVKGAQKEGFYGHRFKGSEELRIFLKEMSILNH